MNQQSGQGAPHVVWAWHCVEVLFSLLTSSIVYFMVERLAIIEVTCQGLCVYHVAQYYRTT